MQILGVTFNDSTSIDKVLIEMHSRGIYKDGLVIFLYNEYFRNYKNQTDAQDLINSFPKENISAQDLIDEVTYGR